VTSTRFFEEERIGEFGGECGLLGFEHLNGFRQRVEFDALFVRELCGFSFRWRRAAACFAARFARSSAAASAAAFRRLFFLPVGRSRRGIRDFSLASRRAGSCKLVQERAVVAHEQQRAANSTSKSRAARARFGVEIVRLLVEHEHVARFREEAREQQAGSLAAGERL